MTGGTLVRMLEVNINVPPIVCKSSKNSEGITYANLFFYGVTPISQNIFFQLDFQIVEDCTETDEL
jgi:hypothetical protein